MVNIDELRLLIKKSWLTHGQEVSRHGGEGGVGKLSQWKDGKVPFKSSAFVTGFLV